MAIKKPISKKAEEQTEEPMTKQSYQWLHGISFFTSVCTS
jgi:hypothetical protein